MKYISYLLLFMASPFVMSAMQQPNQNIEISLTGDPYPPLVTTANQKLTYDSYLGDKNLGRIRQLIKDGADVNYVDPDPRWSTPLSKAAYGAQLGTMEILLAQGANPNLENAVESSPLAHALGAYKNFPVEHDLGFQRRVIGSVARLIRAGANVDHPSVKRYIDRYPELRMVLKQAQEIAKETGPQKLR